MQQAISVLLNMDKADNYYALLLVICRPDYTPEKAISVFSPHRAQMSMSVSRKVITDTDIEQMIRLRKTKSFQEVGEIFGIKAKTVYARIRRYNEKKENRPPHHRD